jgi:hypothetical protein
MFCCSSRAAAEYFFSAMISPVWASRMKMERPASWVVSAGSYSGLLGSPVAL